MGDVIVDVQNLSFSYPDGTKALKNISFKVTKGQIIAVLGANGAGKTTLCQHLTGIIPNIYQGTTEGRAIVAGMNVYDHPVYELAQKISLVTQDPEGQLINPDVLMEVTFGPENLGILREEILRRAKWALEAVASRDLNHDRHPNSQEDKNRDSFSQLVSAWNLNCLCSMSLRHNLTPSEQVKFSTPSFN